jgi:hypothetical protein
MAAYLGVAVVLTIPGVLIAYLLRLRLGMLRTWAAVPLFSLTSVFVLGELTALIGAPFGIPAFVAMLVTLGGAALTKAIRARATRAIDLRDERPASPDGSTLEVWIARSLLVLGISVGAFIWWRGLQDVPLVLPGGDGTRHGFMVGRILYEHSVDPSDVLVLDPGGAHQVVDFFPLGGHASAAMAAGLMSIDAGQALVALTVVFAVVVFPMGMFVLARFLAPDWPLVAGFTALAVPTLTLFPYAVIADGKAFAIVGMAMVPASIVLIAGVVLSTGASSRSLAQTAVNHAPAALALLGLTSVHSSELPLVLFLVLLLVLERAWHHRRARVLRDALIHSLIVALLGLALFAPTLGALVGGGRERSSVRAVGLTSGTAWTDLVGPVLTLRTYLPPEGFASALPGLPSVRQILLATFAFMGAAIWLRYRGGAWVVGWVTVIVLSLFASTTDNRFVRILTFPWYSGSIRINWNQAFFVSLFAAVPLALAVVAMARMLRRRVAIVPAAVVVVALFVAFLGVTAYSTSVSFLRTAFAVEVNTFGNQARVDEDSEAAFQWLDAHTGPDDTVVNEPNVDGSLWMYTQHGVKPLLGLRLVGSSPSQSASQDWDDRNYLVRHIEQVGENPRVDQLARKNRSRWIYFDERTFPLERHDLKIDAIRGNPRISEVFHRNAVHVFRIDIALDGVDAHERRGGGLGHGR